jgi:type II secretory pathway pseudopilin PulG
MLDVHPPEHTPHSWRDFFIHIAIIVIGLLIAIGLEQAVEYIHHRREVSETHERIHAELTEDREAIRQNVAALTNDQQQWQADSDILQQSAPSPQSLANLKYTWKLELMSTSAWQTAGQTGTLSLLRPEEAAKYSYLYTLLDHNISSGAVYIQKVDTAKTIAARLRRQASVSPADQQRLLTISDELGGSAAEQLEMYTFVDASLKDWLDHH